MIHGPGHDLGEPSTAQPALPSPQLSKSEEVAASLTAHQVLKGQHIAELVECHMRINELDLAVRVGRVCGGG